MELATLLEELKNPECIVLSSHANESIVDFRALGHQQAWLSQARCNATALMLERGGDLRKPFHVCDALKGPFNHTEHRRAVLQA